MPVVLPPVDRFDEDLVSIQRFQGKTNESFTKLLVNITVPGGDKVTVLDPMAGRGTTLNQAVLYGWDAIGIEIDKKNCEAYRAFFTTWLKNKRLPHKARHDKQSFSVSFGPDRARFDATPQSVSMINGDSRDVDTLVKKNSIDAIVCDLPYGVRHGSEGAQRRRSPLQLVEQSIEGWARVLRPGGAVGIAFNTHTSPAGNWCRYSAARSTCERSSALRTASISRSTATWLLLVVARPRVQASDGQPTCGGHAEAKTE